MASSRNSSAVCRAVGALALLLWAATATAQTPATFAQRAEFGGDPVFVGRVSVATLIAGVAVLSEGDAVADHALRERLVGYVFRDPDGVARKLAKVLAANVEVQEAGGVVDTTLTDAQLQAFIAARWTALARTMVASFGNVP
jgi:hypothetical protein